MNYQVLELSKCLNLIESNTYAILGLNIEYPYLIPINYQLVKEEDNYFLVIKNYCAGKKYYAIKKNTKVCILLLINNNCFTNSIQINGIATHNPRNLCGNIPNDTIIKIENISGRKIQVS